MFHLMNGISSVEENFTKAAVLGVELDCDKLIEEPSLYI